MPKHHRVILEISQDGRTMESGPQNAWYPSYDGTYRITLWTIYFATSLSNFTRT